MQHRVTWFFWTSLVSRPIELLMEGFYFLDECGIHGKIIVFKEFSNKIFVIIFQIQLKVILLCFVVLQLCCNQLTGNIPAQIGSLKSLNVLTLQHNRLNGGIPDSLGNLGKLKRLDLSFNYLFGTIPESLANNAELLFLDVQNNTLSGIVPSGKSFCYPPYSFLSFV